MRGIWALTMAIMVIALPQVVSAQSTGDFRLPPANSPTPRIQGPTDSENPVLRTTTPARNTTPSPTPSAVVSAPAPTPTRAGPAPIALRPPAANASAAPAPKAGRLASAAATPSPLPEATPSVLPTGANPAASLPPASPPVETASTTASADLPQAAGPAMPFSWPWLVAIGLAVLALGVWWLHGRPAKLVEDDWSHADWLNADEAASDAEVATTAASEYPPSPQVEPTLSPAPAQILPVVEPPVRPAFGREILALSLDPVRMSATLTSTSLSYRLTVTNKSAQAMGPVAIAGSMVSAHASLSTQAQLATDGQLLEVLHEIATLAAGESAVVAGELRLPLPQITPIKSGESLLFIPLARFRAEAGETSAIAAFAIGETSVATSGAMLPLRIDMGPRIWNKISRRQIELAAA